MKYTLRGFIFIVFLPFSFPGHAFSGNELFAFCVSEKTVWSDGYCFGYIIGASEGYDAGRQGGAMLGRFGDAMQTPEEIEQNLEKVIEVTNAAKYYCYPEGVKNQQIVDVVVKFLEDNPKDRHEEARTLVPAALGKAFPCQ